MVKHGQDLIELFGKDIEIPKNIPMRGMLLSRAKNIPPKDCLRLYERIRGVVAFHLPEYGALLGLEESEQWYLQNMEKLRRLIVTRMEG